MHQKMYEAKKQMFGPISFGASTGSNVIRHFLMTVNELCVMFVCMYSGATVINVWNYFSLLWGFWFKMFLWINDFLGIFERSLATELQKLQSMASKVVRVSSTGPVHVGTCLMVIDLSSIKK